MKTFLLILFSCFLFSCSRSDESSGLEMEAGYSYYKVTNSTSDTVRFYVKRFGDGMIVNLKLRPKEEYSFNVSTLGVSDLTTCVDPPYFFDIEDVTSFCFTYPVLDRILQEIEILKK